MINIMRNKKNEKYYLKGYTLVEISIVLLIIGILMAAVIKGRSIIESVKIDSVINDIRTIQIAHDQYLNMTLNKPDTKEFFKQLKQYELIESEKIIPRIGNEYSIIDKDAHQYLQLDNITDKQADILQAKVKSSFDRDLDIKKNENGNNSISMQID